MAKSTKTTSRTAGTPATTQKRTQKPSSDPCCEQGRPIEQNHDEKSDQRAGDIGDLELETLDRHAPYNRTYGIKGESSND